jgi:GGDEF domain-containing protein
MKKPTLLAAEAAWRVKAVCSSWGTQSAPVRPPCGYLAVALEDERDPSNLLLCDPLTGLVAYPSFEAQMIAVLPELATTGLHLAIGDVDDLRGYVNAAKGDDPTQFGHLAGNYCMRRVGLATRQWAAEILDYWQFAICATFGGDEVIVTAAGRPYEDFLAALSVLAGRIRSNSPRPCSFASATTLPMQRMSAAAGDIYRDLLSRVDRCLFCHKAAAKNDGASLDGALIDVGAMPLVGHPDWRSQFGVAEGNCSH